MLTEYNPAAMEHARYEILEDGTYYGEIPNCPGVYTNAGTVERCRDQLREVLEDWIVLGLLTGHTFPVIDGVSLGVEAEAA